MKKVCLIVLDGWGLGGNGPGNATAMARTPNLRALYSGYPCTGLDTSGLSVGLPDGQMGNSEVGHLTMGAGRIIYQELTRITKAVEDGELRENPVLTCLIDSLKARKKALHLMGLLSDGGVHSHIKHLYALLDIARERGLRDVYVHAFLDGRDTPPQSGINYVRELASRMAAKGHGAISTISGRYYAMDRDNRWERVKLAHDAIVCGIGANSDDPVRAVEEAYKKGETDEFVKPVVIKSPGRPAFTIAGGDGVLFFNFRADRARELTRAMTEEGFKGFRRCGNPGLERFVTMTEYDAKMPLPALFRPQSLENILGEVLSRNGVKQFRVSETEKYAHVTFFFNGGKEEPFPGEERLLIPSVKDVPTYDKKPEMRAREIADAAVEKIKEGAYSFILMNFANGDMVGHTGVLDAAVKACEAVDEAVGRVVDAARERGWSVIITSDHGNCEEMIDKKTGETLTAHSTNLVPFILVDDERKSVKLRTNGGLRDIAPTVLKIMDIPKPAEMDGEPMF